MSQELQLRFLLPRFPRSLYVHQREVVYYHASLVQMSYHSHHQQSYSASSSGVRSLQLNAQGLRCPITPSS